MVHQLICFISLCKVCIYGTLVLDKMCNFVCVNRMYNVVVCMSSFN